jgi:hypothetical protein
VSKLAQMQDEQLVQLMGNELVNAPNMDTTQWVEANEQHQFAIKPIVLKNLALPSTTYQVTPQTLTQRRTMSILNGVNNKLVQKFDEVVSA